jgi:DNA-binding XRE family transcriptional regulator
MGTRHWNDIKAHKLSPEKIAEARRQAEDDVLEMNLRALRESVGKTQEDVARSAEMSQSELSRLERRNDHLLSTLRRYVAALGGDIEIVAVFGDKRIPLRGV